MEDILYQKYQKLVQQKYQVLVHLKCTDVHTVDSCSLSSAILDVRKQYTDEDIICIEGFKVNNEE